MCGIFALLNQLGNNGSVKYIEDDFMKGQHRGPEFSVYKNVMIKTAFGFHRLAINGLNDESHQPIYIDNISLICNGEIYNYKELYKLMDIEPETDSDCEVIIHMYKYYGIEQTLQMLDGVFSFCLMDYRLNSNASKMFVARDPYGVRPLYMLKPTKYGKTKYKDKNLYGFASELKMLYGIYENENKNTFPNNCYDIEQFNPGSYSSFIMVHNLMPEWKYIRNASYHSTGFSSCMYRNNLQNDYDTTYRNIQYYLISAIEKRCCTTDRPIACLLSGGLDSSLITALVNEYHKKHNLKTLETYSIGLDGSEDLKYAKQVAEYLGTNHTEVVVTEKDFLDAIPNVIYDIESYDTTTVRASIGNWLIGKYISEHSEAKVIFNGDGADELAGGYLYVGSAPDSIEFDKECRRLLKKIYLFDVLRSDKCISSHGLEPRTPFLDRQWVQYYLSIPLEMRCKTRDIAYYNDEVFVEKFLLRNAFHIDNFKNNEGNELLPRDVLFRRKEAFSDGVSKQTRSLYEITKEHADKYFKEIILPEAVITPLDYEGRYDRIVSFHPTMSLVNNHLLPDDSEKFYYRYLFEKNYKGIGKILPNFWMPKYVDSKDSSARTLDIYNENDTSNNQDEKMIVDGEEK